MKETSRLFPKIIWPQGSRLAQLGVPRGCRNQYLSPCPRGRPWRPRHHLGRICCCLPQQICFLPDKLNGFDPDSHLWFDLRDKHGDSSFVLRLRTSSWQPGCVLPGGWMGPGAGKRINTNEAALSEAGIKLIPGI